MSIIKRLRLEPYVDNQASMLRSLCLNLMSTIKRLCDGLGLSLMLTIKHLCDIGLCLSLCYLVLWYVICEYFMHVLLYCILYDWLYVTTKIPLNLTPFLQYLIHPVEYKGLTGKILSTSDWRLLLQYKYMCWLSEALGIISRLINIYFIPCEISGK